MEQEVITTIVFDAINTSIDSIAKLKYFVARSRAFTIESRKFVTQKHSPRKGTADFVGCHFSLSLNRRISGDRNFPARYTQPQTSQQPQIIFTITTPPLTRVLDRLIAGGISLCGDDI
jgi:hypothetical protein